MRLPSRMAKGSMTNLPPDQEELKRAGLDALVQRHQQVNLAEVNRCLLLNTLRYCLCRVAKMAYCTQLCTALLCFTLLYYGLVKQSTVECSMPLYYAQLCSAVQFCAILCADAEQNVFVELAKWVDTQPVANVLVRWQVNFEGEGVLVDGDVGDQVVWNHP